MREINREEGRIIIHRRTLPREAAVRPVETVEASLERDGAEATEVRLYVAFRDQVSAAPRCPPDDGDEERADDVLSAAVDRSFDAGVVYDAYFDAIEARVEARRSSAGS